MNTEFAPAPRLDDKAIRRQHTLLTSKETAGHLDFFPLPMFVVNTQRQIILINNQFRKKLDISDSQCLGRRPGEAIGCTYAKQGNSGCGSSSHCKECGAVRAVLDSISTNESVAYDFQLLLDTPHGAVAQDLRVHVSPWNMDEETFYVVTIEDIAHEQRRRVLERLFFHDILNAAGGATGLVNLLVDEVSGEAQELAKLIQSSIFTLVENVNSHKELMVIEQGEYNYCREHIHGLDLLHDLAREFSSHEKAYGKNIAVSPDSTNVEICTDKTLLRRVLINMTMNALEASDNGDTVTLRLSHEENRATFSVRNPAQMADDTQLKVFKRSFSTKGEGRGLGTYSIKLITENYLKGAVGFHSDSSDGTVFWITLDCGESSADGRR